MAKRTLKAELEIDAGKAKRQLDSLAGEAASSAGGAAERAAKRIGSLGEAAERTNARIAAAGRAFAGMAAGMAVSYAAKGMKPGAARDAVEYGGAAVAGASAGAAFGPVGAAIGGVAGLVKTYIDRESTRRQATEDFQRGEQDYQSNRAFKKLLDDLTDSGDEFERLQANVERARSELERLQGVERDLVQKVGEFRDRHDERGAKAEEGYLATNRSRQAALESVVKALGRQAKDRAGDRGPAPSARDMGADDALGRVGGYTFGGLVGGGSYLDDGGVGESLLRTSEAARRRTDEMAETLKRIELNTKGGAAWR